MTLEQFTNYFSLAALNALSALGLYVQMRSGQLSVASGAFLGVGAVTAARLVQSGTPLPVGLLAAALVAGILGVAVALPLLRLRGLFFAIATLAFAEVMRVMTMNVPFLGGARGLETNPVREAPTYIAVVIVLVLVWLVRHQRSIIGLRLDSISGAEKAVEMVGVDVRLHRVLAFGVGAAILGITGGLLIHQVTFLSPETYGHETGVETLVFVQLAGVATPFHPVVGAAVVTVLIEVLRPLREFRLMAYAVVLVLITILRTRHLTQPRHSTLPSE